MTIVPASLTFSDAVLEALRQGLDRPVGDAQKPDGATAPYLVVYPGGDPALDGSLADPHADADHTVQITGVGLDRAGAEDVRDLARALLLDRSTLSIEDRTVISTELLTGQPVRRDDDVSPPLFYAVDVIRITTTPA